MSPSPDFTAFADALTGQYELDREIGRGGMGVVYLARDVRLDRRVATRAGGRDIQVSVLPRNGRTTIRVSESLKTIASGIFGGIIGGVGGGSSGPWIGAGIAMHAPLFGILSWAGTTFLAYAGARSLFGSISGKRTTGLRELTERLATQARESIAASTRKLDPPYARRLRG